jgi:hypothetical protein
LKTTAGKPALTEASAVAWKLWRDKTARRIRNENERERRSRTEDPPSPQGFSATSPASQGFGAASENPPSLASYGAAGEDEPGKGSEAFGDETKAPSIGSHQISPDISKSHQKMTRARRIAGRRPNRIGSDQIGVKI